MLEEDRYNRALSEAGEKATAAQKEERSKIEENNKAFAEQEKRKEEDFKLVQGMDNVIVARPNIPVDYTNVEDELSYQEGPSQRKESFSDIINYGDYIDYDPEVQQIYGVPEYAVQAGDINPEFLMKGDILNDVPVMDEVTYNTMKDNLSEKDFKKWYSGVLDERQKSVEEGLKESFETNLPNKKAYEADKAKKDAEWKAYQEGSILDQMDRRAQYAIENPWRAVTSGFTDPIINLFTSDENDVTADDYIYDDIYGTSTAGKGSVLRGTNQFGFGENNIVDMLSPIKPVYDATMSLGNVASGQGNLTDVANIGFGALEVLPYTKAPKAVMKGLKSLGKARPTVPTTLPAPSFNIAPVNLKEGGMKKAQMGGLSKELPSFQRRGQVRLNLPTLSDGEKIGLGTGATFGLLSSFMNPSSSISKNIKVKNTAQNICADGTCPTASDDWRDYTTRANMELGYGEDPNRPGYFSGDEFATGNVGGAFARTFGRTALGAGTGLLTGYGAQWLGNKLAPRVFANPGRLFKESGGEKAQLGKFVKTLGKYADDVLGTTTKVADDVTYTPEQLSNYNYAVDMGVPGVKERTPGNLDEFLSGSFNKMPVYRTVDLNTDVIKQQSVIDDMVSKGFNPDDKLDVASYMGTNTPLEILQDFNKGRRSIHSDILQGSGKDLLYTSDNPDWLIPNYGGSDPYMVKMFLDEKPATVVDQINALSTKFRKPVNDAVGLTPVAQYNLLGSNPVNIGDVPSGALVDNLYKGGNKIYPILGDFGQQLRQPVRVASGDDFFKIRARGEEFQQGGGVYDFSPFGPSSGFSGGKPVFDMNQNDLFPEPFIQQELPEDPPQEETQDDLLNFNLPNQDLVSPYTNTNIGTSTTPSTTTTDESQQITRERIPGSGLYRTLMSPGMGAFTEASDAVRGVFSAVNDVYDNLNYQGAINDQQRGTMADNLFTPTYVDKNPISQGVYGVNTGYLGDILSGDGPSGYDSYRGMAKHGGEIELDTNTIAELIAAGADIEIL
jgi:hypothetical protein